jgi:SAM-dependent methyltransferase
VTGWAQGYVADIPYTAHVYPHTMPANIAFAALCMGRDPGAARTPRRILDLGFGMGFGLVVAAAANPEAQFEGVDFLPIHVAHAAGLAEAAGLTNLSVREASFQELAREAVDGQHDVDLIILHGILSWVSDEARAAIVELAAKRLRPGGLLYVSYNSLPGQAHMLGIRHLLHESAKRSGSSSAAQVRAGLDLLQGLAREDAKLLKGNAEAQKVLDRLAGEDAAYVAHEYLNADWTVFHFSEVAALLGAAKLSYVGSATLAENLDAIAVPAAMRQRIANEADPVFRETLRDAASNKDFRRDIFGRGVAPLLPAERQALLAQTRFVLATVRGQTKNHVQTMFGGVTIKQELCDAVFDLLEHGPADFPTIAALFGPGQFNLAIETLQLLVHSSQVQPVRAGSDSGDVAAAQRLNRVILAKRIEGRPYSVLAAPLTGSGVRIATQDMLMLSALLGGCAEEAEALAAATAALIRQNGGAWVQDGQAITDPAALDAALRAHADIFLGERLPLWRRLQAV